MAVAGAGSGVPPRNAFLAFEPSEGELHSLAAALTEASPGSPLPGRRVPATNWHVTLRFLGPVDDVACDRIAGFLDESLDLESGTIVVRGLGAFPKASNASIVYAAVDDADGTVGALAAQCDEAAQSAGLEPEGRPFVPHITLTRLRPRVDVRSVVDRLGDFSVRMSVRAVTLFRTESVRRGVRYSAVHRIEL